MGQIADALVHAHARGIVHRDLKPANVIFRTDGLVKVLDFGIARLLSAAMMDSRPANSNLTRAGVIIGTRRNMAPEQFLGSEVDERADLYSLGVLLFELVTGQRPHQQRDVIQIAEAKLTGPPPPVAAGVSEGLVSVITRALQGDPAARYQSAEEFGNALRGQSAVVSSPPGRWGVWRGWRAQAHRYTRRWTMAAVAVCALGAGVMLVGRIPRRPQSAQATVAKLPVVAVVPFATLTQGDVQVDSFAGGIPSLIASRLTTLKGMTVVPYSETLLSYRSQPSRASTIARELGADYVVTGEVQRVGQSIVVAVSLVDSASSQSTWSDNYTGDPEDAAGIQRRVIQRVTAAFLERKLASPGEGAPAGDLASQSPTGRNQEALAEYGQGRRYLERPDDPDNLEYALRLFRSATAKEPRFALAYAATGEALWLKYSITKNSEFVDQARESLTEALRLDPNAVEVRYALAVLYEGTGRREQAAEELQQIVEQQPEFDSAHRLYGRILLSQGQVERGLDELRMAVSIRPDYAANHVALGLAYYTAGRYRDAASTFERVTQLQPDNAAALQNLGTAHHMLGDLDQAFQGYQRANALRPTATALSNIGTIHFAHGRLAEAIEAYGKAIELNPRSPSTHINLGDAHRKRGEPSSASAAYLAAVRLCEEQLATTPENGNLMSVLAMAEAKLGRTTVAAPARGGCRASCVRRTRRCCTTRRSHSISPVRTDQAVPLLVEALTRGYNKQLVKLDPDLERLRARPEIKEILGS